MGAVPMQVLLVYVATAVWVALAVRGYRMHAYRPALLWGMALVALLNLRYVIEGVAGGIAFFVSLYSVFDNLGLAAGETAAALAPCADNACSILGEAYVNHPTWGGAFFERFVQGPALRTQLLYGHLVCNTAVFLLMHYQLAHPGRGASQAAHRQLGRVAFVLLTIGTVCAVWLASEHDGVGPYGGALSRYGFWFMSFCVYGCMLAGVAQARRGDAAAHRVWMIRFIGSMWGAFWIFRLMLIVTGPLFRDHEAVALLLSIWLSAPFGIVLAEGLRRRWERRPLASARDPLAASAT